MTQDENGVHALVGAYALDALSEVERRRFENHLDECESCGQEARELRETAARLGAAAAVDPPPGLRERVLAEASRVRPLPHREGRPARLRRILPPWLPAVIAAACLVVAAVSGVTAVRTQQRLDQVQGEQRRMAAVLSARDVQAVSAPMPNGGRGTVVMSRRHDAAVVVMAGLPELPPSQRYGLWLHGSGAPRLAGLMTAAAPPAVVEGMAGTAEVTVTIEPEAGAARPSGTRVFALRLPA